MSMSILNLVKSLIVLSLMGLVLPAAATVVVNTTADTVLADSACSLREALENVVDDAGHPDCVGTAADIRFALPVGAVIKLESALPVLSASVSLVSPHQVTIKRDAVEKFRIFTIIGPGSQGVDAPPVEVVLEGLTLTNGWAGDIPAGVTLTGEIKGDILSGGAIFNAEKLFIKNSIIVDNYAKHNGGGIYNKSSGLMRGYAELVLDNVVIVRNEAGNGGGGINNNRGKLWAQNSIFFQNRLKYSHTKESLNITGAGLSMHNLGATATVLNSVFSENKIFNTDIGGMGSAIYNNKRAYTLIINSLITNNSISYLKAFTNGAGIMVNVGNIDDNGKIDIYNSIVSNNRLQGFPDNISGKVNGKHNIYEPGIGGIINGENNISLAADQIEALLTITASEYAPVYTIVADSAAVDAGYDEAFNQAVTYAAHHNHFMAFVLPLLHDIHGLPRISNGRVDIGPAEYQFPSSPTAPSAPVAPEMGIVNIAAQGNGAVNVTHVAGSKTCRTACSYSYPLGSVINLTPVAEPEHIFTGWNHPQCADWLALERTPSSCVATFRPTVVQYVSTPPANRSLNFVSEYGEAVTQALTITNAQTGVLTVDFLDIVGEHAAAFPTPTAEWPLNLTANASASVVVSCQPLHVGLNRAYLKLTSNDSRKRIVTYLLECTRNALPAAPAPAPAPEPEPEPELNLAPEFGEPTTQQPDHYEVTLQQLGAGDITLNGEPCEDTPCSDLISVGKTVTLSATAAPQWFFKAWQCAGFPTAHPQTRLQIQVDKPLSCTAIFSRRKNLQLKVNVPRQARITSDHPLLTVNCQDECLYDVPPALDGQPIKLKVEVERGWMLQEWAADCYQSHIFSVDEDSNCQLAFQTPPFFSWYREYNGFDGQAGYQFSLPLDTPCITEVSGLDLYQLGDVLKQVSLPLSNLNNRCTVNLVPDTDRDSVPDVIEQAGGNGGDGNYDGIADFQQSHVISVFHKNRRSKRLITIEIDPTCQLDRIVMSPNSFIHRLGMANVVITGCSNSEFRGIYHAVTSNYVEDLSIHNREVSMPYMQSFVRYAGRPGPQSDWHLLATPYVRNLSTDGQVMVNAIGLPVIEAIGFWQQAELPDVPPVAIVLQQPKYTFYEAQQVLAVDVVLNGIITEPLTVHVGSNTLKHPPSYDYTLQPQQLTWIPGQTKLKTVKITTRDDAIPEQDMQIILSLGHASHPNVYFFPDSILDVFILDDDMPPCTPQTLAQLEPDSQDRRFDMRCDLNNQTLNTQDFPVFNDACYLSNGLFKHSCLQRNRDADNTSMGKPLEVALHLNQVTLTHADPQQWIYIPPNSVIGHGTFDHQTFVESSEIIGTPDQYTVFQHDAKLLDSRVWYIHFHNPSNKQLIIVNQGFITHARIDPQVEIRGGTLDGTVSNQGKLVNTEFMGDVLAGGNIIGMMTLHSGSRMQNVKLLTPNSGIRASVNSTTIGDSEELGALAGRIDGDANLPAKLTYLNILPNTHLSNVLLGEGLNFTDKLTLSGVIQGDSTHFPILLENVHITAGTQLNHVRLGQHVTVDNGVIFGDSVQISPDATISCHNAQRLDPETLITAPAAACLFNHFSFIAPTTRSNGQYHADIYITLLTAPQHLNQIGEPLAVAIVNTANDTVAYMRDGQDWLTWAGELHTLTALEKPHKLRRRYRIPLYRGRLNHFDGEFNLYAGYRLANGEIVFNALTPLHFTLSTPLPIPLTQLRAPANAPPPRLTASFFTSFIHPAPAAATHASPTRAADAPLIQLRQHIHVEPQHRQQHGEILAVMLTPQETLYQLTPTGDWQAWNGQLTELKPMARYPYLPDMVQLSLSLPPARVSVVYVGYRVEGEAPVIVFNGGYPVQVSD